MSKRLDTGTIDRLRQDPRRGLCSPAELVSLIDEVKERRSADLGTSHLTALRRLVNEACAGTLKLEDDAFTAVLLVIAAHGETV